MKLEGCYIWQNYGTADFMVGKSKMSTRLTDEEHDMLLQALRPIYARALERFHTDVKSELIEAPCDITPAPILIEATKTNQPFDEEIPF